MIYPNSKQLAAFLEKDGRTVLALKNAFPLDPQVFQSHRQELLRQGLPASEIDDHAAFICLTFDATAPESDAQRVNRLDVEVAELRRDHAGFVKRVIIAMALLIGMLLLLAVKASAQNVNAAEVVATCGTAPSPYPAAGNRAPQTVDVNGNLCTSASPAAAADTVGSTVLLNANGMTASVAVAGQNAVEVHFASGTFVGGVVAEVALDGGSDWNGAWFVNPITGAFDGFSLTNPSLQGETIMFPGPITNARIRVSGYTSGSVSVTLRAVTNQPFRIMYGLDNGQQPRPLLMDTSGKPQVGIQANATVDLSRVAGTGTDTNSGTKSAGTLRVVLATDQPQLTNPLKVDGSAVTQPVSGTFWQATQPVSGTFWQATQPVSGTVTANQGTANATPWTDNITQWNSVALGSPSPYGTSPGAVNVPGVNAAVTNIPHVICDSGCTPGGSFADNSAFTFGSTAVNPTAFVVDDVSTNAVAENSSGTARMSSSRIPYAALTDPTGNPMGSTANPMNVSIRADKTLASASPGASPASSQLIAGRYSNLMAPLKPGQVAPVQVDSYGRTLVSVQASQPIPAQVQDASGVRPVYDPCQSYSKQFGSASMTASTQIITGAAGRRVVFCSWNDQLGGTAQNYAVVEGTGGASCPTNTAAVGGLSGGTTAATGWNVAANGGRTLGNGSAAIGATATPGNNVCVLLSGSIQTNVGYSYVLAP